MKKVETFIFSGNPLGFNLFALNYKQKMTEASDQLTVFRDINFYPGYESEIKRFYNEMLSDIPHHLEFITPPEEINMWNEIPNYLQRSDSDVFVFFHEDFLVLDSDIFKSHVNLLKEDKCDLVFNGFGCGSKDIENIIKTHYPKVIETYKEHFHVLSALDYFIVKTEMFKEPNLPIGTEILQIGSVKRDWLPNGEPHVLEYEYDATLPFIQSQLNWYKRGYQRTNRPFIEQDISVYDMSFLKDIPRFKQHGFVHFNGSNIAKQSLIYWGTHHLFPFTHRPHVERILGMLALPIAFIDLNKYSYLKEFVFEVYIPEIQRRTYQFNHINNENVVIDVNALLTFGRNMELKTYPENFSNLNKF